MYPSFQLSSNAQLSKEPACYGELQWLVLYTLPQKEKKVYLELIKREFEVFLPLHNVVRQWSDRKKTLSVPLFPNYIFVKTDQREMWSALKIQGALRYISFGGAPAVVGELEIELVKKLLYHNVAIKNEESFDFYQRGEKVKVKEGPFKGFEGEILERKSTTRLYLQLLTINRIVSIDVALNCLEKINNFSWKGEFAKWVDGED